MNPDLSALIALIQLGLQEMLLKSLPNGMSWTDGQESAQRAVLETRALRVTWE